LRREYPLGPIVGVGAVIIHENKLLLVKRRVEPAKGKWSIPGGVVELGEGIRDALIREVKEECGLDVEIERLLDVVDNITMDEEGRLQFHFVILDFLARVKGGTLKPADDVLDARWILLDEVETYDLTKSFREFFRRHKNELKVPTKELKT